MTNPSLKALAVHVFARFENESRCCRSTADPEFYTEEVLPTISVEKYTLRCVKYLGCDWYTLMVAGVYMSRLVGHYNTRICPRVAKFVTLTALMIASKFMDDNHYDNTYYAQVGGISLGQLNRFERVFLEKIHFDVCYDKDDLFLFHQEITTSKPFL